MPTGFNIRFPSQYFDEETALHYNRFRYYDPPVGRYVSADPIGQVGGLSGAKRGRSCFLAFSPRRYSCWNFTKRLRSSPRSANATRPSSAVRSRSTS